MSDLKKPGVAEGFDVNVPGGYTGAPTPTHDVDVYWETGVVAASVPVAPVLKPGITGRPHGEMELPAIPLFAAPKPAPVVEKPVENFRLRLSAVHLAAPSASHLNAPSAEPAIPALEAEVEPTQQDTRPADKLAPAPAEPVQTSRRNGWKWAAGLTTFAAAGIAVWAVVNHQKEAPSASDFPTEEAELTPVPVATVEIPAPVPAAAPAHDSAPVYTAVAKAFEGDPQAELEVPKAANELVQGFYAGDSGPHTWKEVRALHPWAENPAALHDLESKLATWGGYTAVLESGELCKPESISDFVNCLANDKNIPHSGLVALNLSEQITAIQDLKIIPDQAAVKEMHEKMNEDVPSMVKEINANPPEAPKPFHYPTATSAAGAEDSLGSLYDAPAPMNLTKEQAASDATDVVDQATAPAGLNGLATWMENAQTALSKKARGKNRELLPDFCAGVAGEMRAIAERFDDLSPSGQEEALLNLKQKFFARMGELRNGDGQFKSKYLEDLSRGFTTALAEMLPPLPEGVEGVQGRTRREVLATLPEGMFRPSVA